MLLNNCWYLKNLGLVFVLTVYAIMIHLVIAKQISCYIVNKKSKKNDYEVKEKKNDKDLDFKKLSFFLCKSFQIEGLEIIKKSYV